MRDPCLRGAAISGRALRIIPRLLQNGRAEDAVLGGGVDAVAYADALSGRAAQEGPFSPRRYARPQKRTEQRC